MTTTTHPVSLTADDLSLWYSSEGRKEKIYELSHAAAYSAAVRRIREQVSAVLRTGTGSVDLLDEVGVCHTLDAADLFESIVGHHDTEILSLLLGALVLEKRDARIARNNADVFFRDFESFILERARYAADNAAMLALIEDGCHVD